ncbi:hypothetical protein ANANG_G00303500 [Anguilla anguilla]|uniref:Uncharacterized protein n=1 Tax=Anguilla anguilla TaxID=7936 RepID=A0A9D3RI50_ANGAN|nr:hypothetical protein ANANG_G00303500 [Anguilla anguilla]
MVSFLEHGLPDLVKTKSIERVVAPVVTHLCHLVLICESGEVSDQFATLEGAAEGVAKASKNMAALASKLAAESDDDVMKAEMEPVVASMKLSGQHMLLAAQKLSIQPQLADHRDELISCTQNVLLGLLKILLVEDDAIVRKIVTSAHLLLDCLSQLEGAPDIPSLLRAFRGFSEALLLLNDLAERRAEDLRDPGQQEHVLTSLDTLKKCVSMLHTALCTTIKHPQSEQAQAAKKYVMDLVDSTINGLILTLKSSCRGGLSGPTGGYTDKLQVLLGLLSIPEHSAIRESNFDSLLGDLVIHCMVVANTSRKFIQSTVVNRCRCVLRLWLEISQQAKLSGSSSDHTQQTQKDLEDKCTYLMQQLLKLNDSIVMAVLYQALDVFVIATAPFDKLLNIASRSPESIKHLLIAFLSHADRMVQVASFISSLSTDLKCIENVESSRACLIRLKGVVVPLVQECGMGSPPSGALERLQDIHQRWAEETSQLTDFLNDILDVKALTSLALQEMAEDYSGCERAFKAQSPNHFIEHATNLMGHMNHMVRSVKRHVDRSDNPIFRNGLLVLVKQVEASIAEATKEKDVTSLSVACTKVLELSNSYIQAAKEADAIINDIEGQRLEGLRLEVVGLTSMLVQTAQESAMGAAMSTDNIYKYATLFSDNISNMRQILLPAAGTWYHAACAMFQGGSQTGNTAQQLSEVMQLCSDVVQLVTSSEILARGEHQESITVLHSKLKKAQTSTKHLAELASSVPVTPDKLEGPCILWALSVQGGTGLTASRGAPSLTYTSLFLKRETDKWDAQNNHVIQVTRAMAEKIYHMTQYLRRRGPIQSKEVFVTTAKDIVSSCRIVTQFVRVIADHSLNERSREDLCLIVEKILTTTNQLTIISSVNALTPGSKSSDEILVKNAQNLLLIILQGVQAAETACIKGLRQPEPNSDGAEAAALCLQWRRNLQIHRAQQNSNPDTDDLGLRKTSLHPPAPSLAPPIQIQGTLKWPS